MLANFILMAPFVYFGWIVALRIGIGTGNLANPLLPGPLIWAAAGITGGAVGGAITLIGMLASHSKTINNPISFLIRGVLVGAIAGLPATIQYYVTGDVMSFFLFIVWHIAMLCFISGWINGYSTLNLIRRKIASKG